MLTRAEQASIMQLVKLAVARATTQGRKQERRRQIGASPDPELRKPVAEMLAELRDYLKEVGEPTLPKNEGAIPCAPQQHSPSDLPWRWPSLPNRKS